MKEIHSLIDWPTIEADFNFIRSMCTPFRIATKNDIERAKIRDITYNIIESDFIEDWKCGICVVVYDDENRQRILDLAEFLAFPDDGSDILLEYKNDKPTIWKETGDLITQRVPTTRLFHLWGQLQSNFGIYGEFYLGNEYLYKKQFH